VYPPLQVLLRKLPSLYVSPDKPDFKSIKNMQFLFYHNLTQEGIRNI
jgi:hypothetical protein